MKKIIGIIVFLMLVILGIFLFVFNKQKEPECEYFTGGGFNIVFNTNGGEKLSPMDVCIACAPDTYNELPIPTKEGYKFDGWYYDKHFLRKVNVNSTLDITPVPKKDGKCVVGYKDITLYAKWSK